MLRSTVSGMQVLTLSVHAGASLGISYDPPRAACTVGHNTTKPLHRHMNRVSLCLRLLLLYRLWVVKRSQGHTCGHFFVRQTALHPPERSLKTAAALLRGSEPGHQIAQCSAQP